MGTKQEEHESRGSLCVDFDTCRYVCVPILRPALVLVSRAYVMAHGRASAVRLYLNVRWQDDAEVQQR